MFTHVSNDPSHRLRLLESIQRMRGWIYAEDGAIPPTALDYRGCHQDGLDACSWHIALFEDGVPQGCVRVGTVPIHQPLEELIAGPVGECLDRMDSMVRLSYRRCLERFVEGTRQAQPDRLMHMTTTGWAVCPGIRGSTESIRLILAPWAMARLLNVAGGTAVATERHRSHRQLVRMGHLPIFGDEAPEMFFDNAFGCRMGFLGQRLDGVNPSLMEELGSVTHLLQRVEVWV